MDNLRSVIFKKNGSAAIILSLIVSGAVLSTIFLTQDTANWFVANQQNNLAADKKNLVSKLAFTLGGYAISNNLILCKEDGWLNYDALCRWNDIESSTVCTDNTGQTISGYCTDAQQEKCTVSAEANAEEVPNSSCENVSQSPSPSSFNLTNEKLVVSKIDREKKALSYRGSLNKMLQGTEDSEIIQNIFTDEEVPEFEITFDLVNWKNANIKNLIGDIPETICRDSRTLNVRAGYCTGGGTKRACTESANSSSATIPNSICENISRMDNDNYIVLMSVKVLGQSSSAKTQAHAGIRRPLAMPIITLSSPPVCRLSCASSTSSTSLSECRGTFTPNSENSISDIRGTVHNPGPGPIYSLSLLKEMRMEIDNSLVREVIDDVVTLGDENREVILPGETVTFQDFIDCADRTNYDFEKRSQTVHRQGIIHRTRYDRRTDLKKYRRYNKRKGAKETHKEEDLSHSTRTNTTVDYDTRTSVNIHAEPLLTLSYRLDSMDTPGGACMKDGPNGEESIEGSCNNGNEGLACGDGGICQYSRIEPARIIGSTTTENQEVKAQEKNILHTTTKTTTVSSVDVFTNTITTVTVHYILPH